MSAFGRMPWRQRYFLGLCLVSMIVLAFPLFARTLVFLPDTAIDTLRLAINPSRENNIGAWWSGALLFMAAIHAFDGYQRHVGDGGRSVGWAWLVIAAVLVALSLDELGSLHERVLLTEGWAGLIPFAVIFAAALAWAAWRLFVDPAERRSILIMATATALFASVPAQEYIEHVIDWPQWVYRLRTGLEEGTELIAMLLFIKASMHNSGGLFATAEAGAAARPVLSAPFSMPAWFVLSIALAIPVFAVVTAMLPDQQRGHPADWISSMLFLLAALASWRNLLSGASTSYPGRIGIGMLFLIASAISIHMHPDWLIDIGVLTLNARLAVLAMLLLGVAAFVGLREKRANDRSASAWLSVGYLAAAACLVSQTLLAAYLLTSVVALSAYRVATARDSSPSAGPGSNEVVDD